MMQKKKVPLAPAPASVSAVKACAFQREDGSLMKRSLVAAMAMAVCCGVSQLQAAWRPGLLGGYASTSAAHDMTVVPANTNAWPCASAATNTTVGGAGLWAANRCWIYWGQIYLPAGNWSIASFNDDTCYIYIDGMLIHNQNGYAAKYTANAVVAAQAGWHDFVVRMGNGTGGAGPVPAALTGMGGAFGFTAVANPPQTFTSDYSFPDGTGDILLRYDDGLGFADILQVQGYPANYGSPVPLYGSIPGFASNDTVACSVDLDWTNTTATVSAHCVGWRIFNQTNLEHDIWIETTNGVGNAFTYTHGDAHARLEWQFDADYQVAFTSAVEACTVVAANGWHGHGTVVSATASNAPGYVFDHWEGEGIPEALRQSPEIMFALTEPVAATATYRNTWYVKEGGDDANSGRSWEAPFATLQHAVGQAAAGESIFVGSGSYNSTSGAEVVRIDKPVKLIGVDGPEVTFLDPKYGLANHPARRAVTVTSAGAGALLAGFTFTNGNDAAKAAPRTLRADGFVVVSNCLFRKAYGAPWAAAHVTINQGCHLYGCHFDGTGDVHSNSEGCGALYATATAPNNALIERCVFVNYDMTAPNFAMIRLGNRGTLRNCLIAGNQTGGGAAGVATPPSGAVALLGTLVEIDGCTIAGNHTRSACGGGGIVASTTGYTVRNTVLWGNTSISSSFQDLHITTGAYADHLNLFHNSCGAFLAEGVNGNVASPPYFTDFAGGDYTFAAMSPCRDAAAARDWHAAATDLAGQPRVRGSAADIGAFEADPAPPVALTVAAVFTPSVLPLPAVIGEPVAFRAAAVGPDLSGLAYAWDFGHDAATGSGASVSHAFPVAGVYTVTCTATAGADSAETTLSVAVAPAIAYVATVGADTPPYDTWEKATPDLAAAVATGAREVLVAAGEFQLPNVRSVILARRLRIRGVSDPTVTAVKAYTSGNARHFDVVHPEARIEGLRLIKGRSGDYGFTAALVISDGVVSNCIVEDVASVSRSSFVQVTGTGRLVDSIVRGRAANIGNRDGHMAAIHISESGLVDRCIVSQYTGYAYGSAYPNHSTAHAALFMDSSAAALRNTLVVDCTNTTTTTGGVLTTNHFGAGLILRNGRVENCTFARNVGAVDGAAIAVRIPGTQSRDTAIPGAIIRNCAFYGNTALNGGLNDIFEYHAAGEVSTCCASELEDGANSNIAAVPTFRYGTWIPAGDSRLVGNGAVLDWMTPDALDLAGQPRIFGRAPDIGAYERTIGAGTHFLVR